MKRNGKQGGESDLDGILSPLHLHFAMPALVLQPANCIFG
jgi:hypothetical protein